MSWQRIDENTYIDDTLVTCAEYQLFIDEMREQGKYCQPDHWTSYQFPKGQAREPILGVRHSDAVAFCEWLNVREKDKWNYRIPTSMETIKFVVQNTKHAPLCCWVKGENTDTQSVWLATNSRDIPIFNLDSEIHNFLSIINYYSTKVTDHFFASNLIREIVDQLHAFYDRSSDHVNAIEQISTRLLGLTQLVEEHYVGLRRNDDLRAELSISGILMIKTSLSDFDQTLSKIQKFAKSLSFALLILKERIAGRSPAFEGIRLVKERIR